MSRRLEARRPRTIVTTSSTITATGNGIRISSGRSEPGLDQQRQPGADQHDRERRPQHRRVDPDRPVAADPDPGDRADQDVADQPEVDVAGAHVREAGRPQQDRGVEDVGADHARGREPEQQDQADGDQSSAAGRGDAEDEADAGAERHGRDLVAALHHDRVALARVHALQERAHQRGRACQQQGDGEHGQQQVVEVVAGRVLDPLEHPHAEDRGGHGADRHPARQLHVDRALAPVLVAAHGLRDGRVGEVGSDRGDRGDPEHEDQHRGHQRAAADARHADEDPYAEPEPD